MRIARKAPPPKKAPPPPRQTEVPDPSAFVPPPPRPREPPPPPEAPPRFFAMSRGRASGSGAGSWPEESAKAGELRNSPAVALWQRAWLRRSLPGVPLVLAGSMTLSAKTPLAPLCEPRAAPNTGNTGAGRRRRSCWGSGRRWSGALVVRSVSPKNVCARRTTAGTSVPSPAKANSGGELRPVSIG